jgi:pyridoxal phosphate enzyme (YggS family)
MEPVGIDVVRGRIAAAAVRVGRDPHEVTLVAVSKGRSNDQLLAAYEHGQRVFGENRQQGLAARMDAGLPRDIEWHFIGPLQRRKVAFVTSNADLVHSFDRRALIERWNGSATPVLLQFNMGREPQKGGFDPDQADDVLAEVRAGGISVRGVMAIPPAVPNPEDARVWFVGLREIYDRFRGTDPTIDTLSMGMSNDFEVAIEEGATMVRVGTAIFGAIHHDATRNR